MGDVRRIGEHFEIGYLMGEGGVGQVFQGRDLRTGDRVAIKVLRSEITMDAPSLAERFRREGEILRELNHPNVVKVLATIQEGDQLYIVMEHVPGGSLADLLSQRGGLPLQRALQIALEVADALARVHHLGIIHRDIKPGNILLAQDGTPRLTDFGLAHINRFPAITMRNDVIGTFQYLSPEGCNREPLDERTDIWSLGVVLFEMLAGERPFEGDAYPGAIVRAILTEPVPSLTHYRDDIPPALDELVRRMLAKNRGARAGSMRAVAAELETILRLVSGPQQPATGGSNRSASAVNNLEQIGGSDSSRAETSLASSDRDIPSTLLSTKYQIPPARPNLVTRKRLIDRLDMGLQGKLILVSAPAGFGKTTLVAEWIGRSGKNEHYATEATATTGPGTGIVKRTSVAWLSLDENDNDPVQFLKYLIASIQQTDRDFGHYLLEALRSPQPPASASAAASLVNEIASRGIEVVLVLDDFHTITSHAVHEVVAFLVEHLPSSMHVAIITREDPPLPLPRMRVRGQLTEIRERDLRFTLDEATAFLVQTMGLRVPADAVAALETRTEGWIAGLQLAALAMQEGSETQESFIAAFTGSDRYVMDYLVTEVLERQSDPVRLFLSETAILDRLTGSLCDAVTGREGSQAMLEQLEAANLFLMPLDNRREWYRYYRLFSEFLQSRLNRDRAGELHRRAATWYEVTGLTGEAIQHALASGALTGQWDDAARLVRSAADEEFRTGAIVTLQGWLDALPDASVRDDAELATYAAWSAAITGNLAQAQIYAETAARAMPASQTSALGKLMTLRAMVALARQDYEKSIESAHEALRHFGEEQTHWRIVALWELAEAQERTRPITEAIGSLREIHRTARGLGNQVFAAAVDGFLAAALDNHGQRRAAEMVCQEAISRYTGDAGQVSPLAAFVSGQLALLSYEANRLEVARQQAGQGLTMAEQIGLPDVLRFSLGVAARVANASGDIDAAMSHLDRARRLVTPGSFGDTTWLRAEEAHLHLQQGETGFVMGWAEDEGLSPDDSPHYLNFESYLTYCRLLLVTGRVLDARCLLARMQSFAHERGFHRWLISVHILQALAAEGLGERTTARDHLLYAVRLAAPEGYLRPFLDEDPRILGLLPAVRPVAPVFIDLLLSSSPADPQAMSRGSFATPPQPLIEPLSDREIEVLHLIAAGLSNAEIADRLIIALGTVKRHINNIYGKLGVESRTQAVARARELNIL